MSKVDSIKAHSMELPLKAFMFRSYPGVWYLSDSKVDGNCPLKVRYLYKYMSLDGLRKTLTSGIRFREPVEWMDGFEKRFYSADYSSLSASYKPEKVFACCFTTNKNSEASWKAYLDIVGLYNSLKEGINLSEESFTIARLKLDRAALRSELSKSLRGSSSYVYECPVQYVSSHSINNCHIPDIPGAKSLHDSLFEKGVFNNDSFLSLLSMKRKEVFEYENEVRYFYIPYEEENITEKLFLLDWTKIIKQVSLVPLYRENPLTSEEVLKVGKSFPLNPVLFKSEDLFHNNDTKQIVIKKR